jgi:drug/metabolite transporter (DMT)-like permease
MRYTAAMPVLTLALSLVVLSQSAVFVRLADAHAVAIGFWRMALALPVLLLMLFWAGRASELRGLERRQWVNLFFCGFLLFAHFYTWFLSVQRTSMAHAMILFCANPLFTAIGAWVFYREKISMRHGVAMLLCFAGIYSLLSDKAGVHTLEGDILGIACSVLFSAYVLVSMGLRRRMANLPFAFAAYGVCTLCFAGMMVLLGLPFFGYSLVTWGAFSGLAFGSTLLGHSLFTHCLQFFHVNTLSISTLLEPALTAVSGYYFFDEPVTRAGMLGFLFVGAGILSLYLPFLRSRVEGFLRKRKYLG